jgi:hypothetical protein
VLSFLKTELSHHGFKLNESLGEFTRNSNDGWSQFHLTFLNRDACWEINLGMLIRKNIVEDIYHRASYYEPKYHKTTPTIGITIENYLNDDKEHRYYLNSESDLDFCITGIIEDFKNIALPFFDKYQSLEAIEKAINVKSGKSIFSGVKYEGNMGIILAKLVNNPDFDYYKNHYFKYYSEKDDGFYLEEFKNILKELDKL